MLKIECPWCGPRDQIEFTCAGEAHIERPADPSALSDAEWADYLFMRANTRGQHREQWQHAHGCGQFFNMARNTVTNRIDAVYRPGERAPEALS